MDFAPEVLANLQAVNMAHLRSLEQGHDILALHPRYKDNISSHTFQIDLTVGHLLTNDQERVKRPTRTQPWTSQPEWVSESRAWLVSRSLLKHLLIEMHLHSLYLMNGFKELESSLSDGLVMVCKQHPSALLIHLMRLYNRNVPCTCIIVPVTGPPRIRVGPGFNSQGSATFFHKYCFPNLY